MRKTLFLILTMMSLSASMGLKSLPGSISEARKTKS